MAAIHSSVQGRMCGVFLFVYDGEGAIDGDPLQSVAIATRSFAVCCCACLKMHLSQLLKHPFTSVTDKKEEREARCAHTMGFNICLSYGDRWDVYCVFPSPTLSFLIETLHRRSHKGDYLRGEFTSISKTVSPEYIKSITL